jgi:hypothetical protein
MRQISSRAHSSTGVATLVDPPWAPPLASLASPTDLRGTRLWHPCGKLSSFKLTAISHLSNNLGFQEGLAHQADHRWDRRVVTQTCDHHRRQDLHQTMIREAGRVGHRLDHQADQADQAGQADQEEDLHRKASPTDRGRHSHRRNDG